MESSKPSDRCIRCGQCMAVCPVYQASFRESDAPRGRLALLETMHRGGHGSKRLKEILSRCLLCGACAEVCANGVDAVTVLQSARKRFFPIRKAYLPGDLKSLKDQDAAVSERIISKGGALLQALLCRRIPETSGLHFRFPLSFFSRRKTVPRISPVPFMKTFGGKVLNTGGKRRVGLFVGCGANYLFPRTAWALIEILERLGVAVVIPSGQACCGLPAFAAGEDERAKNLAQRNIEAFEDSGVDTVLTVCASCGSHLQGLADLFDDLTAWKQRAVALAAKHKDAMVFLVEDLEERFSADITVKVDRRPRRTVHRVAYHDPCHLRIAQGVTAAPRKLLGMLPNVELVEASHRGRCCGHGGGFNLTHFDLSMDILDTRMADFRGIDPEVIATGCTGCLLQMMEGVSRTDAKGKTTVCHPLILARDALKDLPS